MAERGNNHNRSESDSPKQDNPLKITSDALKKMSNKGFVKIYRCNKI